MQSEQQAIKKLGEQIKAQIGKYSGRSVRPSQFLNQLDLIPEIKPPKAHKEQVKRFGAVVEGMGLRKNFSLPKIEESPNFKQLTEMNREPFISPQSDINFTQQITKSSLFPLSLNHLPDNTPKNTDRIEKPARRVIFRNSIQVVDFTNNVISKEQIQGNPKPLRKHTRRLHKKTLSDLVKLTTES